MTEEQLRQGHSLTQEIWRAERISEGLEKVVVRVDKHTSGVFYEQPEEEIELLPEEQDALASMREAYLEVLRTANNRKLSKLKKEFEEL